MTQPEKNSLHEIAVMQKDIEHVKEAVEETQIMLKDLDHTIRGNGVPGLAQKVSVLEALSKNRVQTMTLLAAIASVVVSILAIFIK